MIADGSDGVPLMTTRTRVAVECCRVGQREAGAMKAPIDVDRTVDGVVEGGS
jgi:hypothetical protein